MNGDIELDFTPIPEAHLALEYLMSILDYSGQERYVTVSLTPEFFDYARAAIDKAYRLKRECK